MNIRDFSYSRYFLVLSDGVNFPEKAYQAALKFAAAFEKGVAIMAWCEKSTEQYNEQLNSVKNASAIDHIYGDYTGTYGELTELTERTETPILFIQLQKKGIFSKPMSIFKGLRELRIPYVFFKESMGEIDFSNVLVPVCYLPEEKEKGSYTSNMGRFLNSRLILMQAKDYGSRAAKNLESIKNLYDKFNLKYEIIHAKSNSNKAEKEAIKKANELNVGMVVISTSRDYGLDDIFFGPKELHILNKTNVPLFCINPRGDLYVLCW